MWLATTLLGFTLGFMEPFVGPVVIYPTLTRTPTHVPTWTPAPPTPTIVVTCPGDSNGDGMVTIDELIRAVNASLDGCPK